LRSGPSMVLLCYYRKVATCQSQCDAFVRQKVLQDFVENLVWKRQYSTGHICCLLPVHSAVFVIAVQSQRVPASLAVFANPNASCNTIASLPLALVNGKLIIRDNFAREDPAGDAEVSTQGIAENVA
jgi:hypothetical protein